MVACTPQPVTSTGSNSFDKDSNRVAMAAISGSYMYSLREQNPEGHGTTYFSWLVWYMSCEYFRVSMEW